MRHGLGPEEFDGGNKASPRMEGWEMDPSEPFSEAQKLRTTYALEAVGVWGRIYIQPCSLGHGRLLADPPS